jgi:repressor LexA
MSHRKRPRLITLKQANIIVGIRNFQHIHGYPPTVREIATMMDRARGTIVQQMKSLQKKGIIRTTPRRARSIEILTAA